MHADHIGVETKAATHMLKNMGMRIDHPGDDQIVRDIDGLYSINSRNILFNRCNFATYDSDIEGSIQILRRVNDMTTLQQDIVFLRHHPVLYRSCVNLKNLKPRAGNMERFARDGTTALAPDRARDYHSIDE